VLDGPHLITSSRSWLGTGWVLFPITLDAADPLRFEIRLSRRQDVVALGSHATFVQTLNIERSLESTIQTNTAHILSPSAYVY
jgi:hypothetical protein